MTRMQTTFVSIVTLLALGCATQGDRWPLPSEVATSGTGPFRRLADSETGVPGLPLGRIVAQGDEAIESATPLQNRLLYVSASRNDTPSPEALPESWAIDPTYFGPRRIYLSPESNSIGYMPGTEIRIESTDTESFDGEVFDPWLLTQEDGIHRLFFATANGVYVASSSTIEGPYRSAVQLAENSGTSEVYRRPCAVIDPAGGYLLYLTVADSLAFVTLDSALQASGEISPILIPAAPLANDDSPESAVKHAGAIWATSPTGRTTLRMYFESHREDGSIRLGMMASSDGIEFERFPGRVYDDGDNPSFPVPLVDEQLATRLIVTRDHVVDNVQYRAPIALVTPGSVSYDTN